jgi:oligosaccharyltransferase complex subunit alpha (ribophorin I)
MRVTCSCLVHTRLPPKGLKFGACSCAIGWRIIEQGTSAPEPRIISHTTPEGLDAFTTDNIATKKGGTITYGPFHNIPPSASAAFIKEHQKHVVVHYFFGAPVVEITSLKRSAEISHWGANLNIQNDIALRNAGPAYV